MDLLAKASVQDEHLKRLTMYTLLQQSLLLKKDRSTFEKAAIKSVQIPIASKLMTLVKTQFMQKLVI
jgi:hypothetical protein